MTEPQPNPLAEPEPWNLVAEGYVTHSLPLFEKYAEHALARAELAPASYVLDVATGPGTLALLAARAGHHVSALDFAPNMIERLRQRARERGLELEAQQGDGQNLPFPAASFEAAFSLFGLIFFPERARGFSELLRVLKPGGRGLVSSWTPIESVSEMSVLISAMREELPDLPFGRGSAPLGDPAEMQAEMAGAGFARVEVEQIAFVHEHAGIHAFWESMARGGVPCVLLRKRIGETAWPAFENRIVERLARELGTGPVRVSWTANLGIGTRS